MLIRLLYSYVSQTLQNYGKIRAKIRENFQQQNTFKLHINNKKNTFKIRETEELNLDKSE